MAKYISGRQPSTTVHKLLLQGQYKDVIIDSLQYLSDNNMIDLFALVMPNYIHQ